MANTLTQMDGTSMNIPDENKARLKQLFPACFTETKNDKGELVESIDFEKLKAELGTFSDLFESRREHYVMDWPGKKEALRLIQTQSAATLKPCREESVNFDTTENLFIEGDNLEVLKLLQKSYYGKIKMIYIDPPYNTGKEFIYPDNYTESLETYLEYAGLIDSEGKKFSTNTLNEGRFHTKWLNMMYPRLYLARNLLKDDGVIFISIDDNEVNNLRKICDEIFGEENFLTQIVWKSRYNAAKELHLAQVHQYILFYAKNIECIDPIYLPTNDEYINRYFKYKDNNYEKRGPYRLQPLEAGRSMDNRENLKFGIPGPKGNIIYPKRQWKWGNERVLDALKKGELEFMQTNDGWNVSTKQYLKDENGIEYGVKGFSIIDGIYNQAGTKEQDDLFKTVTLFPFPKPTELIRHLQNIANTKNSDIILDFFSGSATTAHAVLDLNKHDGCHRKFILVQLPEPCQENSEAFKTGYKTIADIGKERIRRVIKKIDKDNSGKLNLEESSTSQDLGFKVLKLDKSNFKQWLQLDPSTSPEKIVEQLELHIEHVDHKATQEDLLYEILIKAGFMPTEKIEIKQIKEKKVFSIADGALLICLEEEVTKDLINEVAELEPIQFICLDAAFKGNDQLKANTVQTFSARNQGREKANQIVFKTI